METLVLFCTVILCTFLGVALGGACLLATLGLVARMVAPER
jgi:hypothetical protein